MSKPGEIRRSTIARWEFVGVVFAWASGSALHFVYAWSNEWNGIAWVAAVNESAWEHLKLAVWPFLFFAVLEYPFIGKSTVNFIPAKIAGLVAAPITIVLVFYSYTGLLGTNYLVVDISLFLASVVVGFVTSFRLCLSPPFSRMTRLISLVVLVSVLLMFVLFTYFPPHMGLFRDPVRGHYGIPPTVESGPAKLPRKTRVVVADSPGRMEPTRGVWIADATTKSGRGLFEATEAP